MPNTVRSKYGHRGALAQWLRHQSILAPTLLYHRLAIIKRNDALVYTAQDNYRE
jgi:hypothetical protein